MQSLRAFIAVKLNSTKKNDIYLKITNSYLKQYNLNFVPKENYHITLRFLGNISNNKITYLINSLSSSLNNLPSFNLHCNTLSAFPSPKHPKVIWLGLENPPQEYYNLLNKIDSALTKENILADIKKKEIPHITLARNKKNITLNNLPLQVNCQIQVHTISLYQSTPSLIKGGGAQYQPLASFSLNCR